MNTTGYDMQLAEMRDRLEAAKLREAELVGQLTESQQREAVVCGKNLALMDERDAALGALEIAQIALKNANASKPCPLYADALAACIDPSAALAERDRGIEKRTAERCAEIAHGMYPAGWCREKILREFNLEPKSEGVVAFFGTWPGDETDKDLHDAARDIL